MIIEENTKVTLHSKAWWADLLDDFAEMTDPVSSDLFLYCKNGSWKTTVIIFNID